MSRSSVKIFLTVSLSIFTCSAMLLTVSRWFSRTIWRTFTMFSSVLLVAGRPDLSSSVTLSLLSEKRFTRKLLFSSTSTNKKKFNVRSFVALIQAPTFSRRHTKTHADSSRFHSERDCHRSTTTTTQLWNADMSTSSNFTKTFVQCCHGKHTVVSSWTLLSLDVYVYVWVCV